MPICRPAKRNGLFQGILLVGVGFALGYLCQHVPTKTEENGDRGEACPPMETTVATPLATTAAAERTEPVVREELRRMRSPEEGRPRTVVQELALRRQLLIGVVTAENFLDTRATGVYRTWGAAASKIMFFSSPGRTRSAADLPVVSLPGVDDTYPPQKKVFTMLKYMYDHHIDDYNWFMRSDDDVYIRVDRLTQFLSQLDPNEPLYVGSPGFGRPEDRERISLRPYEHYCMGGPGVVFSRALLRALGPHLEDCLQNVVVSYNEDVEVGRCVSRTLGVQCTWSYQASKLFYTDYSKGRDFEKPSVYHNRELQAALTVHPFKTPEQMYRVHQFYLELHEEEAVKEERKRKVELHKWQTITGRDRAFG